MKTGDRPYTHQSLHSGPIFINAFCYIAVILEVTAGGAKDLQIRLVARHPLKTLGDWSTFSLKRHADGTSDYLVKGGVSMSTILACSHLAAPIPTLWERGRVSGHQIHQDLHDGSECISVCSSHAMFLSTSFTPSLRRLPCYLPWRNLT